MKKTVKVIALVLAISLIGVMFAACGSKAENNSEPQAEAKEKLIMATKASFPPYEFVSDDGSFDGIDVKIAGLIAEKLGMELEIQDVEFGSIIGGVQSGKFDMGMAGMTVTEERLKSVNFSNTYAVGIQSIIVPEGSDITCFKDFYNEDGTVKDLKVGVQQDTTGDIYVTDDLGADHVVQYKVGNDAVQALKAGKVDAVIIDNGPAKSFVDANEGLVVLESEYTQEEYAICIAKENTELLNKINTALEELTAEGKIAEIINAYISD